MNTTFKTLDQEELTQINGGNAAKTVGKALGKLGGIIGFFDGVDYIKEAGQSFAEGFKESFN